jgi:hypothetical protein|tara:strand:- start:396 stop:593 length:198 start_codon:yes stop_codon:yes gene_type:complete
MQSCPDHKQKIKDLTLIKKRLGNDPEKTLMTHILYEVRNYLRFKKCTDDIKSMSVTKLIALAKKA